MWDRALRPPATGPPQDSALEIDQLLARLEASARRAPRARAASPAGHGAHSNGHGAHFDRNGSKGGAHFDDNGSKGGAAGPLWGFSPPGMAPRASSAAGRGPWRGGDSVNPPNPPPPYCCTYRLPYCSLAPAALLLHLPTPLL